MNIKSISLTSFLCSLLFCSFTAQAQNDLRPPAYPLISVDPYFSVWSMQDELNNGPTLHWTEQEHSLQGIIRVDGEPMYFLGQPIPRYETILPTVGNTRSWQYTFTKPGAGWQENSFNAEGWTTTQGAFSNFGTTPNAWETENIWVRRTFELEDLDSLNLENLMFYMYHDDNVEVYLNGVLAYELTGWVDEYRRIEIREEAKKVLKEGQNLLAIHCENTAGGAYLDAGLVEKQDPEVQVPRAEQTFVEVSATQTKYTFDAGDVELDLTFTAPLLPDNLELISRPANYLTFEVQSKDSQSHDVQLYLSAASNMAVNTASQPVVWQRMPSRDLDIMRLGSANQQVLGRKGDNVRIDWGYLYLASGKEGTSTRIAASEPSISDFVEDGTLDNDDAQDMPRAANSTNVTLATAFDFGTVSAQQKQWHAILAYDDIYAVEYFQQPLQAWWKRDGQSVVEMLEQAEGDYKQLMWETSRFDKQLFADAKAAGGEKYAELTELAYRQSVAAHKLVAGPDGTPLFFSKENFSNGSIGTVDVTYPSSPLFLYYNPTLLKGMLEPIFYYTESGRWTKPFPAHDVGTYPIANGQTYPEDMPVEEAGNMLIMTTAIAQAEGHAQFAEKHWEALSKWANYLMENGLDPKNQLSTDDFSGHLARNANLSVKAITGIAGYGKLAGMLGKEEISKKYLSAAKTMANKWMEMADGGNHYGLTFNQPNSTWSQKYNLVWDNMLGLNVFPDNINKTEIQYYLEQQNEYGLPLDNRETYTKSDWIVWTATLTDDDATFQKFINPMFRAFNETEDRVPMTDWYQTDSAEQVGFQARSVVGGYFMKMLEQKFLQQ